MATDADWQAHDLEPAGTSHAFQRPPRRAAVRRVRDAAASARTTCATRWPRSPSPPRSGIDAERIAEGLRRSPASSGGSRWSATADGVTVYDDFAHHPTAVAETLAGLRAANPAARIWAVFEPRSASSCRRVFQDDFARAFARRRRGGARAGVPIDAAGGRAAVGAAARRDLRGRGQSAREAGIDRRHRRRPSSREHRPGDSSSSCRTAASAASTSKLLRALAALSRVALDDAFRIRPGRRLGVGRRVRRAHRSGDQRARRLRWPSASSAARFEASATSCRRIRSVAVLLRSAADRSRRRSIERARARGGASSRRRRADAAGRSACRCATAASTGPTSARWRAFAGVDRGRGHRGCTPARTYRVFMLGLCRASPTWDRSIRRIAAPRRPTPRVRVPAGSVGIAGVADRHLPGRDARRLADDRPHAAAAVRLRRAPSRSCSGRATPCSSIAIDRASSTGCDRAATADERSLQRHRARPADDRQDLGRWGCRRAACRWPGRWIRVASARQRAGRQRPDAATLEVTLVGPELVFEDERIVAVAGAEFERHRRRPAGRRCTRPFVVPRRTRAAIRPRGRGARAYLAVAGGIDVAAGARQPRDASAEPHGGFDGRALQAGDRLPLGPASGRERARRPRERRSTRRRRRCRAAHARVRVLPARSAIASRPTRSTRCSRRRTCSAPTRTAWASGWRARALRHARRRAR